MAENLPDTNVGNIEYIRKQDALDAFGLSEKTRKYGGDHSGYDTRMLYEIHDALTGISPADVVQVVRCRDCEAWQTDWNPAVPDRHYCAVMDSMMKADDFCSYGKRREE